MVLNLPKNGIRLRFDGPSQRLRLIEVLDFSHTPLTYDGKDVVKVPQDGTTTKGPAFRHVYDRLIGPTFPGEYMPPVEGGGSDHGFYILSYPGVAFTFPLQHSAWSQSRDFVHLLSSQYAEPAKSMAIFDGESWKQARKDMYTRPTPIPRPTTSSGRSKELRPDELELVTIKAKGVLELSRRSTPPFKIILNSTTPQDLITELGPPDAIYRKSDRRLSIHKAHRKSRSSASSTGRDESTDTGYSSHAVTTDESDGDDEEGQINHHRLTTDAECFYNYFHHGLDIFMSYPQPTPDRRSLPTSTDTSTISAVTEPNQLVATKVLLYGNIPGSYPFNRYRRCRWKLDRPTNKHKSPNKQVTSETPFSEISRTLSQSLQRESGGESTQHNFKQGMVLNRGWGNSPGSSCELLGGWEETGKPQNLAGEKMMAEEGPGSGNTELFGFPGLVFEVLKNDTVSCLTIY